MKWWHRNQDGSITCLLCCHVCRITPGESGSCDLHFNESGILRTPYLGAISSVGLDPIEKKPLYHFFPGSLTWSLGFSGCSFDCPFCQNHRISKDPVQILQKVSPRDIVESALVHKARSISYTYSEPTIHYDFIQAVAKEATEMGLENVLVTNGNLNRRFAKVLLDVMDAVNVDIKSWNPDYYRTTLKGNLKTVLNFVEEANSTTWTEITTLVVPGDNDRESHIRDMAKWLSELENPPVLHLTAYHPARSYRKGATKSTSLRRLGNLCRESLPYVYLGNIGEREVTQCHSCGTPVFRRGDSSFSGLCHQCGKRIPGRFAEQREP